MKLKDVTDLTTEEHVIAVDIKLNFISITVPFFTTVYLKNKKCRLKAYISLFS